MTQANGVSGRGGEADHRFGVLDSWSRFAVVRWHAVEAISAPYRVAIDLMTPIADAEDDLDALLDQPATLRVRGAAGWREVHGVVAEIEELERTATLAFYRAVLAPHVVRAATRRRCRTWRRTSVLDIVASVLMDDVPGAPSSGRGLDASVDPKPLSGEPSFAAFDPPRGTLSIAVADPALADPDHRPYVVQYNESDLDFARRLLEEEGVSFVFQQAAEGDVMVVTDRPGHVDVLGRSPLGLALRADAHAGTSEGQEVVRALRRKRRVRARSAGVRDFDAFSRKTLDAADPDPTAEHVEHLEFPSFEGIAADARRGATKTACARSARNRRERLDVERALLSGAATARGLEPGRAVVVADASRGPVEIVIVAVETYASELAPGGALLDDEPFGFDGRATTPSYACRFEAAPASVPYRPAIATPKPRVHGIQQAIVTAEELPEGGRPAINVSAHGEVRVRFPWDERPEEAGVPSSEWVFVSQLWAGPAYGGQHHARVGHSVLCAFHDGDPDRPVVVGRVHCEPSPAPYDARPRARR